MHFIDGLSYEEIAKALNKNEGAIRVIQYRALSDLRGLIEWE
jgi:DNA-directed RNA polymerase specialized sigma24 family protein